MSLVRFSGFVEGFLEKTPLKHMAGVVVSCGRKTSTANNQKESSLNRSAVSYSASIIASVTCVVDEEPPRSGVKTFPSVSTVIIAFSMRSAHRFSPR